jgi:hypothetical protein
MRLIICEDGDCPDIDYKFFVSCSRGIPGAVIAEELPSSALL